MDIEFAIKILGWNIALPAGVAMAILFALSRCLPERYAAGIAFCAATMTGYLLLDWAKLVPERHYQWLPWLPILTLVTAALSLRKDTHVTERLLAFVPIAAIVAFLIVPGWKRLDDVRWIYLLTVGVVAWVQCGLWDWLATKTNPLLFAVFAALALGGTAGLLMPFLSMKFGQMLLCTTGAVTGIGLLSVRTDTPDRARAIAPLVGVVLTAGAFIGFVDPDPAEFAFLVPLAIPLLLVPLAVFGKEKKRVLVVITQTLLAIGIIGGTGWWLQSQQSDQADEYGDYY